MSQASKFFLKGIEGPVKGQEFVILGEEIRVGRTAENDIVLNQGSISRHHASLKTRKDGLWIEDAKSRNGVFVNEEKVTARILHPNDLVRVGDNVFKVGIDLKKTHASRPPKLPRLPRAPRVTLPKIGLKRIVMYSVAISVLGYGYSLSKQTPSYSRPVRTEQAEVEKAPALPPDLSAFETRNVSQAEVISWQSRADMALKYEDINQAIPLLRKVLAARPQDEKAKLQLIRAETQLTLLIRKYDESAAKEYEKMYYDNALLQWRKVLSLSEDFDPETYRRTEMRIHKVEMKLAQMK